MPVPQSWADLSQTAANNSPQGAEIVGPYSNDYLQAAFSFLRQLYDNGGLPNKAQNNNNQQLNNLAAGTALTDAVNLQQLNTVLGAPSGTRAVFQQAAAPTGWTVDSNAAFSDCSMRFNQAVGNGGSLGWSGWNFGGQFNVAAHVLTVAEMPSHAHSDAGHGHGIGDGGHAHGVNDGGHSHAYNTYVSQAPQSGSSTQCLTGMQSARTSNDACNISIAASGTGISIGTGYANIQANGGNAGHVHTLTTPQCKYADCIIGIKS